MKTLIDNIVAEINRVVLGKEDQIKLALATFIAKGHLMIEDIPGVGKTTLAKTMAKVLNLDYTRIQFTSDLLPSDILGVNIFDAKSSTFSFKKGSIFTEFLLADEINRSTPKTQSALLEAMEEHQVTIDGVTRELPKPFFVIATQNPLEDIGVFELPKSQLDRFYITINIGYPDREAERKIIMGDKIEDLNQINSFNLEEVVKLQNSLKSITLSPAIVEYIQDIVAFSRSKIYHTGISTRGVIVLTKMAKAWAMVEGREFVIPEDIQKILPYIIAHRLKKVEENLSAKEIAREIILASRVD